MAAVPPLRPHQLAHILKLYKALSLRGYTQTAAIQEIAELYDRHPGHLRTLIMRLMTDTTDIARTYFKSNALKMAMSVVREANVQQKMDILERPNIGVLAPKKIGNAEGSRGFFLTVSQDSCGAVKVGAAMIEGALPEGSPAEQEEGENVGPPDTMPAESERVQLAGIPEAEVVTPKPKHDRWMGKSKVYREAVEKAKRKLELARKV